MRFTYLVVLAALVVSCASIRNVEYKEPKIDIINLKNGEIVKGDKIIVKLNISNFNLVTPDNYQEQGKGHVQVWMDDMEFRGSKNEFIFQNESNGIHTIKAELMMSNNTILPYSKTIRIIVNNT